MFEIIKKRRSLRSYTGDPVEKSEIKKILEMGTLAPSGKNGQPWRFAIVQDDKELLHKIADCTVYKSFVSQADCLICVLMDKAESYHYIKDCQAIGACIQNMLLAATELNLGACWIGEILNKASVVKKLLGIDNRYDLMAVVALGHKGEIDGERVPRKSLDEVVLFYR